MLLTPGVAPWCFIVCLCPLGMVKFKHTENTWFGLEKGWYQDKGYRERFSWWVFLKSLSLYDSDMAFYLNFKTDFFPTVQGLRILSYIFNSLTLWMYHCTTWNNTEYIVKKTPVPIKMFDSLGDFHVLLTYVIIIYIMRLI